MTPKRAALVLRLLERRPGLPLAMAKTAVMMTARMRRLLEMSR